MVEDLYPQLKAEREALEIQKAAIVAQFRNSGIFCATRNKSNLLMWSHYADEHRGVVFGLQPDAAQDSFLCLLEPDTYSDVRPSFYNPFDPLVGNMPLPTLEAMRAFTRSLTAVKSMQWAYEEELRVVIPSYVSEGQPAVFIPYYATELAELYLGHRVAAGDRDELVAAARALNKDDAGLFRSLAACLEHQPATFVLWPAEAKRRVQRQRAEEEPEGAGRPFRSTRACRQTGRD